MLRWVRRSVSWLVGSPVITSSSSLLKTTARSEPSAWAASAAAAAACVKVLGAGGVLGEGGDADAGREAKLGLAEDAPEAGEDLLGEQEGGALVGLRQDRELGDAGTGDGVDPAGRVVEQRAISVIAGRSRGCPAFCASRRPVTWTLSTRRGGRPSAPGRSRR